MNKLSTIILLLLHFTNVNAQCCNCEDEISVISYATGLDNNSKHLAAGTLDSNWIITLAPTTSGISTPTYPWVISKFNSWGRLDTALLTTISSKGGWISPFKTASTNNNNDEPLDPYVFTYTFCVCKPGTFSIKGILHADDWASLDIDGAHPVFTTTSNAYHVYVYDKDVFLQTGVHTLNINIRNLEGVAMGFNCSGSIMPKSIGATLALTNLDTSSSSRDTLLCKDGFLKLTPDTMSHNVMYEWSTGSTEDHITISSGGTYWVTASGQCGVIIDSIIATEVDVTATIINADTTICTGDTILLYGTINPQIAAFRWSNGGDTSLIIKANAAGYYELTTEHSGCIAYDHIEIGHFPHIYVDLGEDKEICEDEILILPKHVTSEQEDTYLWQDGSTDREYKIPEAGRYIVNITNTCGTIADTVDITFRNCYIFFPSAFSPNRDGLNDVARLVGDFVIISNYELHIFNRWGKEVFTSKNLNDGWDGNYNNHAADIGTYYYYITLKYLGEDKIMKGDLTLVR